MMRKPSTKLFEGGEKENEWKVETLYTAIKGFHEMRGHLS